MTSSSQLKLTPAQRRFLERFDAYTSFGNTPREYLSLREEWHVQHRTMNWCYRKGFLKKATSANQVAFIVDPEKREALSLQPSGRIMTKRLSPRKRLVRILLG